MVYERQVQSAARATRWALGNVDPKVEPNIDRVTSKANQLTNEE